MESKASPDRSSYEHLRVSKSNTSYPEMDLATHLGHLAESGDRSQCSFHPMDERTGWLGGEMFSLICAHRVHLGETVYRYYLPFKEV